MRAKVYNISVSSYLCCSSKQIGFVQVDTQRVSYRWVKMKELSVSQEFSVSMPPQTDGKIRLNACPSSSSIAKHNNSKFPSGT